MGFFSILDSRADAEQGGAVSVPLVGIGVFQSADMGSRAGDVAMLKKSEIKGSSIQTFSLERDHAPSCVVVWNCYGLIAICLVGFVGI